MAYRDKVSTPLRKTVAVNPGWVRVDTGDPSIAQAAACALAAKVRRLHAPARASRRRDVVEFVDALYEDLCSAHDAAAAQLSWEHDILTDGAPAELARVIENSIITVDGIYSRDVGAPGIEYLSAQTPS
jgi:hypothetical protein